MNFHPIANIFPLMNDAEFSELCEDIRVNGLIVPILIYNNLIIDGRNRFQACVDTGIDPHFEEWTGEPENLSNFVISLNLRRRHLDDTQRARVAAKLANMSRGDSSSQRDMPSGISVSIAEAASLLNVSERSVHRAKAVERNACEAVKEMLETKELSLSEAAEIATKVPPTKQVRVLKKGGKNQLVSLAQNMRVETTLKKAKSTHDACLICNHELEANDDTFVAMMRLLAAKHPKFSRYVQGIIEEIDDMYVAGEMDDVYDKILLAVDAGYQTETEICKFTKLSEDIVISTLKIMSGASLEVVQQGGKPDEARGGRKKLYQRRTKKITNEYLEARELGYIDEPVINDFSN